MKVAVSSSGRDLTAQLDPRFGRCRYFLIVDTRNMSFEVFENKNAVLGGGAGIQAAQFVASKGAKAVLTGNCGPNAMQTFSAAGVRVYTNQSGSVKNVVDKFKNGELNPATEANAPFHAGMERMGMGRGKGMGRGRGISQSSGMGSRIKTRKGL